MALLLAAYLVSLALRRPDQHSLLLDGWLVGVFELAASVLCFAQVLRRHRFRGIPLVLGLAILSWTLGDFVFTLESASGPPPVPSFPDIFYLGFYPLMYGGVLLILRRHLTTLVPATWLDGAVAGLGAATVCATFAFRSILQTLGGNPLGVATNLAYPVGDVLLLALVVGGTAVLPSLRRTQWMLLALACALNALGDAFNLLHMANVESSALGIVLDGIAWPASLLIISLSVWLRPPHAVLAAPERAPGFVLPGLGAVAGLVVLFAGTLHPIGIVAVGLATATLGTVGIRLALSVRGLRALTEERQRQAVTDELTGLRNRRQLFHVLNAFFADLADPRIPPRRLAFLFVDLNHFKEVNDSFGHSAGDELLRQLGPRLAGSLRETDVLVRLGGDELGVVLMDTDPAVAEVVARRLTAKLDEPFVLGAGVTVRVSASIGIAVAPGDATDAAGLLRSADAAMYRAKLERSAFHVYEASMQGGGDRLQLVEDLKGAVERAEFVLHYQPLVDLRTNEVVAVEALLRWPHPTLGAVPPLEFLPLAEEAGLMRPLTAFVLDRALAQCANWRAAGTPLDLSVNISATNLRDPNFLELVSDLLARHALPASALILEVTETTIIGSLAECRTVIAALRDLGVSVSIDDFGAGFTSLAYLGGLAADELKLDRAFIIGLAAEGRERDVALVRSTIELGHALGLRVVAEGVEDEASLTLLASVGCDLAQGYFISRPLLPNDLALTADPGPAAALA